MKQVDGTPPIGAEAFFPQTLCTYLQALSAATTSDAVWAGLVTLAKALRLELVDYVHSADEHGAHIRSTLPARREAPFVRPTTLGPRLVGTAYGDNTGLRQLNAGLLIPLTSDTPDQTAMIVFGSAAPRATFEHLIETQAHTLHVAAMAAHTRYGQLHNAEFVTRAGLTPKQKELLRYVGLGYMDKQIAHSLGISFSAVRQRLAMVQQKTGAQNRSELAAMATKAGLVGNPLAKTPCPEGDTDHPVAAIQTHAAE
ncbi:helix-turn-helix transcriptional regulator [Tropicibacter naphthalenivorans]|uniref:ATP-dependent transcriptional regulator n=1 Tax=Tropicibacter naphthalenivorans TaxID=441103 RepID=A0A0P1G3R8_9RHOB|nr:LuxR C-terminal-related transcriptional regulator [Tropicibacter naphthalenivorans]CUH76475.1 ATP-dependent transcriptional regulator [Tropicibacter naphthalenivorans]SMC65945.1 regulatory protein, luxR family [Tropicibacter naphthalenivorans]